MRWWDWRWRLVSGEPSARSVAANQRGRSKSRGVRLGPISWRRFPTFVHSVDIGHYHAATVRRCCCCCYCCEIRRRYHRVKGQRLLLFIQVN